MEAETIMKLRTLGVVAALALVAGNAQAQDAAPAGGTDAGWDTKYGILFTLPNPFGGGSGANVLSDYDNGVNGKVGFQYNLGAQNALRLSLDLDRTSNGIIETTIGTNKFETVPDPTSTIDINLMAQYMIRVSPAAVSPYFGVGVFVDANLESMKGEDKTNGTVTTKYDNSATTLGFGVNGTLGLEWRVHKVISLFAEYQADLTLISSTSAKTEETSGTFTTKTESSQKSFANLSTGIAQNGRLGVIAFF